MSRQLSSKTQVQILKTLKERFERNTRIPKEINWEELEQRLKANPEKLWSLSEMEQSGGEPDVVDFNEDTGEFIFIDSSKESPAGRRSLCYDREALETRKENKPKNSALDLAADMGVTILDEEQYRKYQQLIGFDSKTSSWIETPAEIRRLGGAIFCDYRFGKVFTYHNGASSYYASRGFRGWLAV